MILFVFLNNYFRLERKKNKFIDYASWNYLIRWFKKKNKNKKRREINKNKKFFETFIPFLSIYLPIKPISSIKHEINNVVDKNEIFLRLRSWGISNA